MPNKICIFMYENELHNNADHIIICFFKFRYLNTEMKGGLFTLPDSDTDSDSNSNCKPNNYIRL